MDKFKLKLNSLREEIEQQTTRADELTEQLRQLEFDSTNKDFDLNSLLSKVELSENQLKLVKEHLELTKFNHQESEEKCKKLDKTNEEIVQKIEEAEKRHEELKDLYKTAREQMEILERELEGF